MSRKKMSRYQTKNATMADSEQEVQTDGAAVAKVTLVKPLQTEKSAEQDVLAGDGVTAKLSPARPKVGRLPSIAISRESKDSEASTGDTLADKETPEEKEFQNDWADIASPRPWDFKFALLLVTLFIAVNLGLVVLLHNNHTSLNTTSARTRLPKISDSTTSADAAPLAAPVVVPPPVKPVLVSPPVAVVPTTAPVKLALVPAAAPVAAPVKPAPVITVAPEQPAVLQQDLLSIIGKD